MNEKVLMSAFYINELLVRLLPRGEPEPALFTIYYDTLKKLAVEKDYLVPLRYFERDFLKVLGYALPSGPFPAKHYRFVEAILLPMTARPLRQRYIRCDVRSPEQQYASERNAGMGSPNVDA